jgi:CHRD domain-containing protein
MKKLVSALVAGAVVSLVTAGLALGTAHANYKVGATLTAKAEVMPASTAGAGAKGTFTGKYVENKSGAVLTWKLSFSGLTGAASAAHIHLGKAGVAGAVIVPLCGPCTSGKTGKATISKTVIAALEGGKAYVNVHTAMNAGGEIRGQVKVTG